MPGASRSPDPPERPEAIDLLTAGSTFARYEVVRCIGVGGMGAVFEATHTLLRKRVAIKALHANLGRSDTSRARFLREAETVARIRHANVVDISDVGVERGIPFLVMEYLEGEDLASLLAREGKLGLTRAVDLLLPAVAGLCAVHRLGIVHRDLKPENIFLARDALGGEVPKLVDFGVSKDIDAASSKDGLAMGHTVVGTPYYMAPEQARGSAVLDGRADQYALGVVLYQCLSLVRPFDSESLLELIHLIDAGQYVALHERCPELPPELCAVVARAMARRAEDRYPSTEAFGQALSAFASEAVAASCARDFAVERRSALPRSGFGVDPERLSAPTVPEAVLPPSGSHPAVRRSRSGVQPRDSATSAGREPAPGAALRPRRAFWLSALLTFVLLCSVGAYLLWRDEPRPRVVADESSAPPAVPSAGVRPEAPPAPASGTPPAVDPSAPAPQPALDAQAPAQASPAAPGARPPPRERAPGKAKREPKPSTQAPVDIQLSR